MKISELLNDLKIYEHKEPLLPIADFHSINTLSIYKDQYKKALVDKDKNTIKTLRDKGKRDGLAILYGGTEWTLSKDGGVSMDEAVDIIKNFYSGLPDLKQLQDGQKRLANNSGYVKNFFGGIRYLPFANMRKAPDGMDNKMFFSIKSKASRLALNAPIQSSSAVQVLLILIQMGNYIEENRLSRFYGNLKNSYKPYTRIVGMDIDKWDDSFEEKLNELDDGIVKFLVKDEDKIVMEYERNVSMHKDFVKSHNLEILW